MHYQLPRLPYAYDALEPYIDARTMEIHHSKHHQAYTDKLNGVLEKYPALADRDIAELLRTLEKLAMAEADKKILRNHGGGYVNHDLFWKIMGPKKAVDEKLKSEVEETFGSFDSFKEQLTQAAVNQFGSGWAWLIRNEKGKLQIYSSPNQDSPYMQGHTPIIGLDVWEHAYYLKYQNRRPEYIENWWQVLRCL